MRIHRLEGRSPVLGTVRLRLPQGLVAVVGRDGRSISAFLRLLRKALLGAASVQGDETARLVVRGPRPDVGLPVQDLAVVRLGGGGEEDPGAVLRGAAEALARVRGAARLDESITRLLEGRGEEEGARLLAEVDPGALRQRVRELEGAPDELVPLEGELRELRADHAELAGEVEVATMEWLRQRQDAETHLQAYRDRARELKARLTQLESAGPEAPCPTCGRILHVRFDDVVTELREEWESVVQDGSWWRRRREQLDLKPDALQEMEGRSLRLQAAMEEAAERVERARARERQLRSSRERLRELEGEEGPGARGEASPDGSGAPEDEAAAEPALVLLRAMTRLKDELVGEARDRILELGSRTLIRVSGSRLLGMTWRGAGEVVELEGVGDRLVEPTVEDRAAAVVALRIGVAMAVLEEGGDLPGVLVLGAPFDRMDEESRLRTVDVLAGVRERIGQVLVVTRGDVVEAIPEAFDSVLELGSGGANGGPSVRTLAAGVGSIRIG